MPLGSVKLYAGPKVQERLKAVAPNLERTVDYGWLWLIAEPIFWLLTWLHGFIGNWGFSIIILTMLIKLAFFHLSATSYKSMARMRKLQPRVTDLRDRFAGDKQKPFSCCFWSLQPLRSAHSRSWTTRPTRR